MNLFELIQNTPLRDLPFPGFNKLAIIVINFVTMLLVFTVVNHTKAKGNKSKIFFLMTTFILLWVDGAYLARLLGNSQLIALVLLKIAWFATPWVFFFTYLISHSFAGKNRENRTLSRILFSLSAVASLTTLFTNTVVFGFKFTNGILDIIYGIFFYPYLLVVLVIIIATIIPLIKVKLTLGARAFLIGVIIFYLLNGIFNITLPVFFHITNLYFLGDYSTVFLLAATTYSILRHKLFDIKVFATELLTVIIWAVLLGRIFLFAGGLLESLTDLGIFMTVVVFGMLVIRSVNKEVQQKEKLLELSNELKQIDLKKNEFISMAAHELRAPLTAVRGFLSMVIEGDTGPISDKAKEFLLDSMTSSQRMIRLVNNMLDVGRIEEGRLTLSLSSFPLSRVVDSVHAEFSGEALNRKLGFIIQKEDNVKDQVYADEDKVHEVVVNLVSNAIKYTEAGSVTLRLFNHRPNSVRFEVVDTGMGISSEEQKKLFKKFYRVKSNIGKTIGTGLGLYISKLLVTRFGGEIGVVSEVGKGSTFWFELPVR